MIRNPRVRQPLAALLLGLTLGGCHSWRVETGNPSQAIASQPSRSIRVQKRDGEVLEIDLPKVVGDSIRGLRADRFGNIRVVVALADVRRLESNHLSGRKSALFVTGIVLVVVAGCLHCRGGI